MQNLQNFSCKEPDLMAATGIRHVLQKRHVAMYLYIYQHIISISSGILPPETLEQSFGTTIARDGFG
jgi:hypothetical protein